MTTLDGVERALTADDLLICDAERVAQGIAGIMGGAAAEVSDTTTEILLESAYFERVGHREDVEAARAALRGERALRARRRPERRRGAARRGRWSCFAEVAARAARPGAIDVYPRPIERARITRAHRRASTACSAPTLSDADVARAAHAARHRGVATGDARRVVPDVASRPRARDRPRRGGRAAGRARPRSRARCPSSPEKIGGLTRAPAATAGAVADVLVGAGYRRGVHAAAARARRPRARRACRPIA